jgi:hypothetical protein
MIGENDDFFCGSSNNNAGCRVSQNAITGYQCSSPSVQCLQTDGSGWYIVQATETGSGTAEHCYAYLDSECVDDLAEFDSEYYQGCQLTCEWSFESNLQWLIDQVY